MRIVSLLTHTVGTQLDDRENVCKYALIDVSSVPSVIHYSHVIDRLSSIGVQPRISYWQFSSLPNKFV